MRKLAAFALIFACLNAQAQEGDGEKKVLTGKIISVSAFAMGHLTYSSLEKLDTRWVQLPGSGWSTGAGFHLNLDNSWGVETDFGLEQNVYQYDNSTLRFNLGYLVPYIDLKVSKFFKRDNSHTRFWYVKVGGAYHLVSGQSRVDEAFNYRTSITLASSGVISIMPEVGTFSRLGGNNYLQFGIICNYGLSTLVTNQLQALPELNTATATASGTFIGVTVKYFYGFAAFGGPRNGSKRPPLGGGRVTL